MESYNPQAEAERERKLSQWIADATAAHHASYPSPEDTIVGVHSGGNMALVHLAPNFLAVIYVPAPGICAPMELGMN